MKRIRRLQNVVISFLVGFNEVGKSMIWTLNIQLSGNQKFKTMLKTKTLQSKIVVTPWAAGVYRFG